MHNSRFFLVLSMVWLSACSTRMVQHPPEANLRVDSETWTIAELLRSTLKNVEIQGSPSVDNNNQQAVYFDGIDDRVLVSGNPLAATKEFTIEMLFFPYSAFPENMAPRVVHLENTTDPNRRVTLELRLTENSRWYFDAFIKSPQGGVTLVDPALTHPTEQWHHAAISYRDGIFKTYINGNLELTSEADFQDLGINVQVSIGARLNHVHWFKGAVHSVHFAKAAYNPAEFQLLGKSLSNKH